MTNNNNAAETTMTKTYKIEANGPNFDLYLAVAGGWQFAGKYSTRIYAENAAPAYAQFLAAQRAAMTTEIHSDEYERGKADAIDECQRGLALADAEDLISYSDDYRSGYLLVASPAYIVPPRPIVVCNYEPVGGLDEAVIASR